MSDLNKEIPIQAPGRFPNDSPFPSWHPPAPFMTDEAALVAIIWQFIVCGLSGIASILIIYNSTGRSTLNSVLVIYILSTSAAVCSFILFDVGKSFSILGALHNMSEVVVLLLFVTRGKLKRWIITSALVYWSSVVALCIIFPWPIDGLFFKIQGLISDMALVVHFYNLLNANKQAQTTHYIPVVSTPQRNHHGISTLIGNVSNAIQDISRRDSEEVELVKREEIGISSEEAADWTRFYLPLVGAIVHAFGNTPTTMFGKSAFWFDLFLFSYGVSYPFYTYFLYLNVIAEKSNLPNGTIVWPEYTKKDHIKIFVGCSVVVLVVMGTALLNA